jgi:hypothetical protein
MTTFSWNVKHLKEDDRGYAASLLCELQGTSNTGATKIASVVTSFGGADYKPKLQWTQEQIDQFAENHRASLEQEIESLFTLKGN